MALTPQFSISALNPSASGYSGAGNPYLYGSLYSYGGMTGPYSPNRLDAQHSNDELIIGYDPFDPADENDITNYGDGILRRSAYRLDVGAYGVRADHQFLFVFGLTNPLNLSHPAVAQFFVGTEWVRSDPIDDPTETVALLVDSPGDGTAALNIFVRLAAQSPSARIGLTGIEAFIL
jgi:hypothetical protein